MNNDTPERNQIREAVFRAVDRVNELTLDEHAVLPEESTILLGEGAALDSMGFVNFVIAVEEEMSGVSDQRIDVSGLFNSPEPHAATISTIGQLIDFLHESLQKSARS